MRLRSALLSAALAGSLALAGCGEDPSGGASPTTTTTAASDSDVATPEPAGTAIPDDFPLSAGMGGPQDTIPTSRTGTGLRDLTLCGTAPLRGLGVRDRLVADNSGGESANTRELVLLGNADEAAQVSQAFADLPLTCPTVTADGDQETLTEVRESPFGPAPATTLVQTYTFDGEPGTGATIIHVVPVGAALLVTSTYGQWTGGSVEEGMGATVDALREAVDAMRMFGDEDVATSTPAPTSALPEPAGPAIPDDFPLAVGFDADNVDNRVSPPSPDGDGMGELEMCGRVVWPQRETSGGLRRLVAQISGPEYHEWRELFVHDDADRATAPMAVIRQAAADCRRQRNLVWTVLDRDTGYDTVTVGLTYSDGLGSSVFQVTRVGSARLLVGTYGEGSLASLDEQADGVTETTEQILPAMCVFTKTGC
ncbi:hypothetical protein [Nocardioides sp.]|uniref:hypothetical protein n=1 Tax=Nocardioides sp. TaxID=35761 RepID=UPI0035B13D4A